MIALSCNINSHEVERNIRMKKDVTKIYDMFDGTHESCEIVTIELKNLIEIWLNELKKFNKK